jgi:membrane-associated phospholipid phosphatase
MPTPDLLRARDYNRSIAPPIRWIHIALVPLRPLIAWFTHPARITWAPYLVLAGLAVWLLLPHDEANLHRFSLRTQFDTNLFYAGPILFLLLALATRTQRRRLADGAAALALTALAALALKVLFARPRPFLDEPEIFLGPLGAYPLGPEIGFRSSWQIWDAHTSALWSMPSSGIALTAATSIIIATTYPRLRSVAVLLLAAVSIATALTGAHYLTDIVAGAALGLAVAHTTLRFRWGQHLLDATTSPPRPPLAAKLASPTQATGPRANPQPPERCPSG